MPPFRGGPGNVDDAGRSDLDDLVALCGIESGRFSVEYSVGDVSEQPFVESAAALAGCE
jgi:hypothetical protein